MSKIIEMLKNKSLPQAQVALIKMYLISYLTIVNAQLDVIDEQLKAQEVVS